MIIDIHAHISNNDLKGMHVNNATPKIIEQQARKYGVERVYIMATFFPLKNSGTMNYPVVEKIKGNDFFRMFGSLDFEQDFQTSINELKDLAENKLIAGLKIYPGYQNFKLSDDRVNEVCQIAKDYTLPIAIHTGALHHCCREYKDKSIMHLCGYKDCPLEARKSYASPELLADIAKNHPDVNFIACHMSNPFFKDMRKVLKSRDNIFTDMSGQFLSSSHEDTTEYKEEIKKEMEKTISECGIEKLLFGTDFPIQSYKDSVELIESLSISTDDKDQIYYKNAKRFLKEEY